MSFDENGTAAARCTADKSDQTTQRLMHTQKAKNMLLVKGWTDLRPFRAVTHGEESTTDAADT